MTLRLAVARRSCVADHRLQRRRASAERARRRRTRNASTRRRRGACRARSRSKARPRRTRRSTSSSDPACARSNPDGLSLETSSSNNGGLENVFVYVKDGLGNYYFETPTDSGDAGSEGLPLSAARVRRASRAAARDRQQRPDAAQRQRDGQGQPEFNLGQPIQGMKNTKMFTAPEVMVPHQVRRARLDERLRGRPRSSVLRGDGRRRHIRAEERSRQAPTQSRPGTRSSATQTQSVTLGGERNERRQLHLQGARAP